MPDQNLPPTPRLERLGAVAARLADIEVELGRLDMSVAMLNGEDYYRLDVCAQTLRIVVDDMSQRVDAMAMGR